MRLSITLLFFFINYLAVGQQLNISGKIIDNQNNPLAFANVQITSSDNEIIDGTTTDEEGKFEFTNIAQGKYIIKACCIGYSDYASNITVEENLVLDNIVMKTQSVELSEIVVKSIKHAISYKNDRYIVSLKDTYIGATNTMDVLKFAPGVMIDNKGNILLRRKHVTLIVDDRELKLKGEELRDYLQNINGEDIESIEVLSNPPAEMDAEGSGGIIKLNLKKGTQKGTNLYFNTGFDIGKAPNAYNSLGMNYTKNNITVYSSYSFNHYQPYLEYQDINTSIHNSVKLVSDQRFHEKKNSHNYRGGLDFSPNDKHYFSLSLDGSISDKNTFDADDLTRIYNGETLNTSIIGDYPNQTDYDHFGINFNYILNMDDLGSKVKLISDYFSSSNERNNNYGSTYYSGEDFDDIVKRIQRKSEYLNDIRIFTSRLDYIKVYNKNTRVETGLKFSDVQSDSKNMFWNNTNNTWILDANRSDRFSYSENIYAAYTKINCKFNALELSAGLRAEHTIFQTNSHTLNTTSTKSYTELFPTLFLTHPIFNHDKIHLKYTRRIFRPEYRLMNPFEYYLNDYNLKRGNVNLHPSFSHNFELLYDLKGKLYFTFNYSIQDDEVGEFYIRKDDSNITINTYKNLANSDLFTLSISNSSTLFNWWSMDNDIYIGYNIYKDHDYSIESAALDVSSNHNFLLGKNIKANMGFHFSPKGSTYLYDTYSSNTYSMDLSIQKRFWDGKADLGIYVNDILYRSGNFETKNNYKGQKIYSNIKKDTRRVGFYFKYRLGWGNKINVSKNEKSNGEELGRK